MKDPKVHTTAAGVLHFSKKKVVYVSLLALTITYTTTKDIVNHHELKGKLSIKIALMELMDLNWLLVTYILSSRPCSHIMK